jgi:hypothetical protein
MAKKEEEVPLGRAIAQDAAYIKKPLLPVAQGIQSGREIKPPVNPAETGKKEK